MNNNQKVIDYIRDNPQVGRKKLSELFGITESTARYLKVADIGIKEQNEITDSNINIGILKFITDSPRTVVDIANKFNISPLMVEKAISELNASSYIIHQEGNMILSDPSIKKQDNISIDIQRHGCSEIIFGGVADTHLGSKYERLDVLNSIYDRFEKEGVKTVYHGGNWIDGEARFNKTDIYAYGLGNQVKNFIEKYPQRNGIVNYIISGDDHEGWYVQRENINIGQYMQMQAEKAGRFDLIDAGYMERDFEFKQSGGSSTMRLVHAGGGSSYATSYSAQKLTESLQGGEKPQIILIGHYHKFEYGYPREIHVVQLGTTCFTANTKIETVNGRKSIKDIVVGEMVLTDCGRYMPVTKTYKNKHDGTFTKITFSRKNRSDNTITPTSNHPIKIERNGNIQYVEAKDVIVGDIVFVVGHKCNCCDNIIPYWQKLCKNCNPMDMDGVVEKLSNTKGGFKRTRSTSGSGLTHMQKDIIPFCESMQNDGWRIVPVGSQIIPDAVGYKDGKLVLFELESQKGNYRKFKELKYQDSYINKFVDDIQWIDTGKRVEQKRGEYEVAENGFVKVPVISVETKNIKTKTVYNIEVEGDHTYVAGRVCVHNCDQTPFMRKKKLQAMVGGCIFRMKQSDNGIITSFSVEWMPYYDKKFYEYKW